MMPETRLPDGALMAQNGRARRRAGGARGRDDARRLHVGRRRPQARARGRAGRRARRDRRPVVPARLVDASATACCAGRSSAASSRSVESLKIGFSALGISANEQLEEEEEPISSGMWVGTVVAALALAIGLFFVVPVGLTSLFKDKLGSAFLFWLVEGVLRTTIFLGYLWLLSRLRGPAARVRVPRRRAQDDLLLRGRRAADARERAALLAPAPALRHELPADRDDRRHLRLRAARACPAWYLLVASRILGVPLIAGPLVRGHQVRRQQPPQALGADAHVARHAAAEADHARARPRRSSRSRSPRMEAVLAVEDPRNASAEDTVGMEVVA